MVNLHTCPVELLRGRQTLTPDEYALWVAAVHGHLPEEVKYDPDTDILWYERRFDWDDPATGCSTPLYDTNPAWKPKRKRLKTKGHSIKSFADLALLTRAWRKPKYKRLRYLYVKDGVIIEYESVKRCAASSALPLTEDPLELEEVNHIKERIAALGADSFFMVHNKYYVHPVPSEVDRKLASTLGQVLELRGHIVLSPCWFGLIVSKGLAILRLLADMNIPNSHPVTGAYLNVTAATSFQVSTISNWAKALTKRRRPVVFSIWERTILRELEEISLDRIDTWNRLVGKIAMKLADLSSTYPAGVKASPLLKLGWFYNLYPLRRRG